MVRRGRHRRQYRCNLVDYTILAKDWTKTGAKNVLLQTIYGTAQDSAGNITANTGKAMTLGKGCAMAFAVPQATALDKGIFKCFGGPIRPGDSLQIRFYDVTGKNYLLYSGHPTLSRTDPGSGGAKLFEIIATTPNPIPAGFSHSELGDGRTYFNLVINFGAMEVTAGEYLIVFDQYSGSNTWGTMVRGNSSTVADAMGKYGDGILRLCRNVQQSASAGLQEIRFIMN